MNGASHAIWLPAWTLVWREIVRFFRQRSRIVTAVLSPLLMWVVIGAGIGKLFSSPLAPGGKGYLEYFFPGTIVMVMLFTSIFSTISIIEDRREGFLQSVLVAPVSRLSIVVGRVLGATFLAVIQGVLLLLVAPFAGISLGFGNVILTIITLTYLSFGLAALGVWIAWRMDSIQGFHGIMNLFLIPTWFLSGALFPAHGTATWIKWLMMVNPLTYGTALLRQALYVGQPFESAMLPPASFSILIVGVFSVLLLFGCVREVNRQKIIGS